MVAMVHDICLCNYRVDFDAIELDGILYLTKILHIILGGSVFFSHIVNDHYSKMKHILHIHTNAPLEIKI